MRVYLFSGLGGDARIFQRFSLPEPYRVITIDWLPPNRSESLSTYAKRLIEQIDTTEPFALVGQSFGGLVATEISHHVTPHRTIVISSAPTSYHLPWYFRVTGRLRLHRLVPIKWFISPNGKLTHWFMSQKTEEQRSLLNDIFASSDVTFVRWAVDKMLRWQMPSKHEKVVHIHGDADRILPVRFAKPDLTIPNGSHFMIYDDASKVNQLVRQLLDAEREEQDYFRGKFSA